MRSSILHSLVFGLALAHSAACGGGQKPGGAKGAASEPVIAGTAKKKDEPKRDISKDARSDFGSVAAAFAAADKGGRWSEGDCRQLADRFAAVYREHPELVEAQYMVGLSYHRCNLLDDAESAYQKAAKAKGGHAQSMSNLGEIYFRAGKQDAAKQQWEGALKIQSKLAGAHTNLASLLIEQMRDTKDATKWKALEEQARLHLSSALAVDSNSVKAYTLYGLLYMEGREKNKNRLDLAKLLLEEGEKRNDNYAPLKNARGIYFLYRANLSEALKQFTLAVEIDPRFVEARMNVGFTTLGFRKYDAAKEQFAKVLDLDSKNYQARIGLGIALRGLGDMDGAEAEYKKAKELDPKRGEAFFNLGVLYKDFRAAKQSDLRASQQAYRTARDYFREFLGKPGSEADKSEAKGNIGDCEKLISQLEEFIKNQQNQPPPPAAPAAPAAPPAGGAGRM
ncbi:MAG: tetratricopeptide repeat protein [Myxococcales bacterium]|nr:tetratricopeptide repeat protein [Myxococcales bacterium]